MPDDDSRCLGTAAYIVSRKEVTRDGQLVMTREGNWLNRYLLAAVEVVGSVGHVLCHC